MTVSRDTRGKMRQFKATATLPFMQSSGAEKPTELQQLEIQVRVTGLFAETTQIMHFFNPNARDLEGNLTFPLPDNGVVCGYGLDVNGVMVDGVVVPKKKARQILEAEERKGIDPGLVQHVQGNVYQTRIYPIPANGTRIVKITYTSDLQVSGNAAVYHLPLQHVETVKQASLRIEVAQSPQKPVISGGQGNMTMTKWSQVWIAEASLEPHLLTEDLQIRLPDLPDSVTMIETTEDENTFFCVSQLVQSSTDQVMWLPKRIALAWDASGSRTAIDRDLLFLEQLLSRWQGCVLDVVVFRNELASDVRTFTIEQETTQELLQYLQALPYDGATDLSALDLTAGPGTEVDAWLLFSDGLDTLEQRLPTHGTLPVIPVVSQVQRNGALLNHLAAQSDGQVIDLGSQTIDAACARLWYRTPGFNIATVKGCADTHIVHQENRLLVSGQLTGDKGLVQVKHPDGRNHTFTFARQDSSKGKILARQWAGRKVQLLALLGEEQGGDAINLCSQFGIVSPGTSLLVLENLEQYLEYDVEPPQSLAGMRRDFFRLRQLGQEEKIASKKEHLESIVMLWKERVSWWEKDHHAGYEKKRSIPKKSYRARDVHESLDDFLPADEGQASVDNEVFASLCMPESDEAGSLQTFHDFDEWDSAPLQAAANENTSHAAITVKAWNPEMPYLGLIQGASFEQQYSVYLDQRLLHQASPSFFLDCGDYFLSSGQTALGLRVLSNLLEIQLEDISLMRIYGWRLQQAGKLDEAVRIFERIQHLRDDEPQSHRDLGLALAERWEQSGDRDDATRAMEALYTVVEQQWDRFPEIELIAMMELNRLIHLAATKQIAAPEKIDDRLRRLLDLDVRISMSWDADHTDVDLHVFEPDGSHAYYASNHTAQGGLVSRDFTQGYGPEEYVLRKALPGTYTIKAHYYGSHQQTVFGPCTVNVTVFTNYGRANEKKKTLTLRLDKSGDDFVVGEVMIEGGNAIPENKPIPTLPDKATFRKIRLGMGTRQVVDLLGHPHKVDYKRDTGVFTLEYNLDDGASVQVEMKYTVRAVKQIIDGAEIDLLAVS